MAERRQSARATNGNGKADWTADDWATAINAEWRKQVPGIINTGKLLIEAKAALGHGKWGAMLGEEPFVFGKLDSGPRIAQMLMKIAAHPALANPKNFSHLPPVYSTLHELSAIPPDRLQQMIVDGAVHPRLKGALAKQLRAGYILVDELPKTLESLVNFLDRCDDDDGKIDADTLGRLAHRINQHFGLAGRGDIGRFKGWLLPRLAGLLDQLQASYDARFLDPDKVVRDGKLMFAQPREIAAPEPEEAPVD